jgi:hypothetical protein
MRSGLILARRCVKPPATDGVAGLGGRARTGAPSERTAQHRSSQPNTASGMWRSSMPLRQGDQASDVLSRRRKS